MPHILTLLIILFAATATTARGVRTDITPQPTDITPRTEGETAEDPLEEQRRVDSLAFRLAHHYTLGDNFRVRADSMMLAPLDAEVGADTCYVPDDALVAVADLLDLADSVGGTRVKLVDALGRTGWTTEAEMLRQVVPDTPVSRFIDCLTRWRGVWMTVLVAMGIVGWTLWRTLRHRLRLVRYDALDSVCPPLLLFFVSLTAVLYAAVQMYVPEFWQEYYFHPTLNPLLLPMPMSLLLWSVWASLLLSIAVVIEVYQHFFFVQGMVYLLSVAGLSMALYLLITLTAPIYIGYVLFVLVTVQAVRIYLRRIRRPLRCGRCGRPLRHTGKCPWCGAENE